MTLKIWGIFPTHIHNYLKRVLIPHSLHKTDTQKSYLQKRWIIKKDLTPNPLYHLLNINIKKHLSVSLLSGMVFKEKCIESNEWLIPIFLSGCRHLTRQGSVEEDMYGSSHTPTWMVKKHRLKGETQNSMTLRLGHFLIFYCFSINVF